MTSIFLASAYFFASKITAAGSAPYFCFITGIPIFFACSSICSIDAALKVSPAANTQVNPFFVRKFATLAIVVVLPEPLNPKKTII